MPLPASSPLAELRNALLTFHKALLDAERLGYEKVNGAIRSPNHFLQLLTGDPWFAWLRPLSLHIITIDEAMEAKEPLTSEATEALIGQAAQVLAAIEKGETSSGRYPDTLQHDPRVVVAYANVRRHLGGQYLPV